MKTAEILDYLRQFGLSEQPTPWDEHEYILWDVDWKEYPMYGSDCRRWSFKEENGDVEKIFLTIYDSKFGGLETTINEIHDMSELVKSIDVFAGYL